MNDHPPQEEWGPPEAGEWQCPRCRVIYAGDGPTRSDGICQPCAMGFHEHLVTDARDRQPKSGEDR